MKSKIGLVLLVLCCNTFSIVTVYNGYTFGPVFNWSFGTKTHYTSIGFNMYYWEFRDAIPWSVGIGYERGSDDQNLIFSEVQTGDFLIGASSGIIFSDRKGIGFQGSIWGNAFAGANIRYRYLDENIFCPGLYISVPIIKTSGNFE
jgi:hypothetical protein